MRIAYKKTLAALFGLPVHIAGNAFAIKHHLVLAQLFLAISLESKNIVPLTRSKHLPGMGRTQKIVQILLAHPRPDLLQVFLVGGNAVLV